MKKSFSVILATLLIATMLLSACGPTETTAPTAAPVVPTVAHEADVCRPLDAGLPDAQRKYHPGHYVSIGRAELRKGVSTAFGEGVRGIQLRYRWADLEPAENQYDFSAVARDLGIAAMIYELGTDFFQDCTSFENTILPDNLDSLRYFAKVARTPYLTFVESFIRHLRAEPACGARTSS